MTGFNQIERSRRTAIYIRISTSQQQTDRQETELKEFALRNGLNFNEKTDMYIDIISGFKEGEARPQYSILKNKVEAGLYQQILFSEFSRSVNKGLGKECHPLAAYRPNKRNAFEEFFEER